MRPSKRAFLGLGFVALLSGLLPVAPGLADDVKPLVNADKDKIAIQGYDPVAYFTWSKPAKGQPDYEVSWQGARWRFASAEHKELFSKNPDTYAPRFGGFCAWGVAMDVKVRADPQNWVIVDGRLYLAADKIVAQDLVDMPGTVAKAEKNWDKLTQ